MRKNVSLRLLIVACVDQYGGTVHLDQVRREAAHDNITVGSKRLDKYAADLVNEGILRRVSNGTYARAESATDGSRGEFGKVPYGDCLFGRLLLFMSRKRYVNMVLVLEALRPWNPQLSPQAVSHAFGYLKRKQYIEKVGTGAYTLAPKTLAAMGLEDVLDAKGPYVAPVAEQLVEPVRKFLSALPPKNGNEICAHLVRLGLEFEKPDMYRAIYRLSARKVGRGRYTLVPATEPRAASALA